MKLPCLLICLLQLFATGCIYDPAETTSLVNEEFKSYTAYRGLNINAGRITEQLTVNGKLTAANADLNNVVLNGASEISNSKITGIAEVNGSLMANNVNFAKDLILNGKMQATHCNFMQDITANTEVLELSKSKAKRIHIIQGKEPVVKISAGTVVLGDIVFDSGKGQVIIDKSSKVIGSIYSGMAQADQIQIEVGK